MVGSIWKIVVALSVVIGLIGGVLTLFDVAPWRQTTRIQYSGSEAGTQETAAFGCKLIENIGRPIYLDLQLIDDEPNLGSPGGMIAEDAHRTNWAINSSEEDGLVVHLTAASDDCSDLRYNMGFSEKRMSKYPTTQFLLDYREIPLIVEIKGYFIIDPPNFQPTSVHTSVQVREIEKP